jgi:hypothetical protein
MSGEEYGVPGGTVVDSLGIDRLFGDSIHRRRHA